MKRALKAGLAVFAAALLAAGGAGAYFLHTHPEFPAKYTLHRFVHACIKGSDKQILRYSSIAQIVPLWDYYDAEGKLLSSDVQAETEKYIASLRELFSGVTDYELIFCKSFAAYMPALSEAMRADRMSYEPKSVGLYSDRFISYTENVRDSYMLAIRYTTPDGKEETEPVLVNLTELGWRADPASVSAVYLLDIDPDFYETESEKENGS